MQYRPDIDGLRAVSIVAVLIFHAFPELLPGGFLGVDIFFVISGYLIFTIIYREMQRGTFKFRNFYARRIRRIFPALIAVLFVTFVLGWFLFYPAEFEQLSKNILAGIFFVVNFQLYREGGYFDAASETKPLLHLWSLSIEEQFYLVMPLLIFLCFRMRLKLLPVLVFLWIFSFISCIYLTHNNPSGAFYFSFSRFFEILTGCILAYSVLNYNWLENVPKKILSILSCSGIILIFSSLIFYQQGAAFSGVYVLLPLLGAGLLIFAGQEAFFNRALANKGMVFIGLISYSLYLWHWVLLVYATPFFEQLFLSNIYIYI